MAGRPQEDSGPRFLIKGQYIKDLSFENPHSPHNLMALDEKPQIDVGVSLATQSFADQHFELTLKFGVRAASNKNTLFLLELDYAGIIQLVGIPEDRIEMILLVDCAHILFPFARRVVADVTRDGGFPPLLLEPIDFHSLYLQKKQ